MMRKHLLHAIAAAALAAPAAQAAMPVIDTSAALQRARDFYMQSTNWITQITNTIEDMNNFMY